jgi:putative membrane protein
MKKVTSLLCGLCLLAWACNNENKDSVEKADSANDAKLNNDSGNANTQTIKTDESTTNFLVDAADGGMMEVQMGQVAAQKGNNAAVKAYGNMMVKDHTAANDKVKALAAQRNVTLPMAVSDAHQKDIDDLNKKTGRDFDKMYINEMVDDHDHDISMFEKAADKVNDTEVKAFINNTLPTLRMHRDSIKAIQKRIK